MNLQGLWNVFDSYWSGSVEQPLHPSLAAPSETPSPSSSTTPPPAGSLPTPGIIHPETTEDPDTESVEPFSSYQMIEVDDDGNPLNGELSSDENDDMPPPPSQPVMGGAPPAATSPRSLSPASKDQRRKEIEGKIAELRWGRAGNTTHQQELDRLSSADRKPRIYVKDSQNIN